VGSRLQRRSTSVELPADAVLCFFTDGLIVRPGRPIARGLAQLRKVVRAGPADAVCQQVIASLIGGAPPGDDVALLVLRRADQEANEEPLG
jgi:hypothetical protein